MKPVDDPNFYRLPPPPGRSRESTIVLDAGGRFLHDGAPVEHPRLAQAMHSWISRHPYDGRYILANGYDWTYFAVEDAPYLVASAENTEAGIRIRLSDNSTELWQVESSYIDAAGIVRTQVKHSAARGPYPAKFTRHAQTALAPVLEALPDGGIAIRCGDRAVEVPTGRPIGPRPTAP